MHNTKYVYCITYLFCCMCDMQGYGRNGSTRYASRFAGQDNDNTNPTLLHWGNHTDTEATSSGRGAHHQWSGLSASRREGNSNYSQVSSQTTYLPTLYFHMLRTCPGTYMPMYIYIRSHISTDVPTTYLHEYPVILYAIIGSTFGFHHLLSNRLHV